MEQKTKWVGYQSEVGKKVPLRTYLVMTLVLVCQENYKTTHYTKFQDRLPVGN
jgi:hypothetical protein